MKWDTSNQRALGLSCPNTTLNDGSQPCQFEMDPLLGKYSTSWRNVHSTGGMSWRLHWLDLSVQYDQCIFYPSWVFFHIGLRFYRLWRFYRITRKLKNPVPKCCLTGTFNPAALTFMSCMLLPDLSPLFAGSLRPRDACVDMLYWILDLVIFLKSIDLQR